MLGPLDQIFTRIGASDDLASGRSTFMVEMTEVGGDPAPRHREQPGADGRGRPRHLDFRRHGAGLCHLPASAGKNRALTLFATHYFELTLLASNTARSPTCISMPSSTTKDRLPACRGKAPPNQSYGIQVAALAGIPSSVVRAAKKQLREFEQRASINPLQPDLFASGATPEPDRPNRRSTGAGRPAADRPGCAVAARGR